MENSLSGEADSFSYGQEIHRFYENHILLKYSATGAYQTPVQSCQQPVYFKIILILSLPLNPCH
jgi:hypothetical protein